MRRASSRAHRPRRFAGILAGSLVGFYILFPLDRGYPRPSVFGRPVSSALLASFIVAVALLFYSRGRILRFIRDRYFALQCAFTLVLIVAAVRALSIPIALHQVAVYWVTFALNYVIVRYAIDSSGEKPFVSTVLVFIVAAATVGVLEGVAGIRLSPYAHWFEVYFNRSAPDLSGGPVRGVGTLNHPILYGAAMGLCIPYVLDIRSRWRKYAVLGLVVTAAVLTGSRTVLLVIGVLMVGLVLITNARTSLRIAAVISCAIGILAQQNVVEIAAKNPTLRFIVARLGAGTDLVATVAAENILVRQNALAIGWDRILDDPSAANLLIGRGLMSAAHVGEQVFEGYNTVDNTYLATLYEKGIVGSLLFVFAFGAALIGSSRVAKASIHWYAVPAILLMGVSFNFESYSTFNALAIGSLAIATARHRRTLSSGALRPVARTTLPQSMTPVEPRMTRGDAIT